MKATDKKRQHWMALFESAVLQLDSRFAGRINWDHAIFHFNQGSSPGLAALKLVQNDQPKGLPFPSNVHH